MAEIRRLLDTLLPHPRADRDPVTHALNWSAWRKRRQAIARRCHYRKRSSGHEPLLEYYRLLHVAARLTRGGRRLRLRISATWPWRTELATAFRRLAALPRPAG